MQLLQTRITLKEKQSKVCVCLMKQVSWGRNACLYHGCSASLTLTSDSHYISQSYKQISEPHCMCWEHTEDICGWGYSTTYMLGTRHKATVSWWRGQKKGVGGEKNCWKPSGKASCRKCHEHNCRRKTVSQLLLGRLAKEETPNRGWGEPLWD